MISHVCLEHTDERCDSAGGKLLIGCKVQEIPEIMVCLLYGLNIAPDYRFNVINLPRRCLIDQKICSTLKIISFIIDITWYLSHKPFVISEETKNNLGQHIFNRTRKPMLFVYMWEERRQF